MVIDDTIKCKIDLKTNFKCLSFKGKRVYSLELSCVYVIPQIIFPFKGFFFTVTNE